MTKTTRVQARAKRLVQQVKKQPIRIQQNTVVKKRKPRQGKAKKVHRKIKPNIIAVCCKDKDGKFGWLRYRCTLPQSITSSQTIEAEHLQKRITIVGKFEDATKFIQQAGAIQLAEKASTELGLKTKIFKHLSMNITKMKSII